MKLKALDQVHISSVQADSLRPGQEFEVGDDLGEKMLKSLPAHLARVEEVGAEPSAPVRTPVKKAAPPHPNKAIPAAPANKAAPKRKPKAK